MSKEEFNIDLNRIETKLNEIQSITEKVKLKIEKVEETYNSWLNDKVKSNKALININRLKDDIAILFNESFEEIGINKSEDNLIDIYDWLKNLSLTELSEYYDKYKEIDKYIESIKRSGFNKPNNEEYVLTPEGRFVRENPYHKAIQDFNNDQNDKLPAQIKELINRDFVMNNYDGTTRARQGLSTVLSGLKVICIEKGYPILKNEDLQKYIKQSDGTDFTIGTIKQKKL